MWGLVESGSITKIINNPKSMVIGDVQYSRNIFSSRWTNAEREAIGIYEVEFDNTNKKMSNGILIPINHLLLLVEKLQLVMDQVQLKHTQIVYGLTKIIQMD